MADAVFISLGPDCAELFRWSEDRLVQATTEQEGEGGPVGGVYLGRVVKLERTLNAAFVEVGLERPGILPLKKHDTLSEGDDLAVQVRRDAREEKGVRLARFNAKPNLVADKKSPSLLIPPPMLWQMALQALVPERVDVIHCDRRNDVDKVIAAAPELKKKVQHTPRRTWEMNDAAANEEIAVALQEEVPLSSGGNLLIEPVRTLTAIDVNSGDASARRGEGGGIGETALSVNLAAAREIPIQLALRNIGGVIVIDFIDIEHRGKRDQVVEALREAVIVDPAIDWVGNMSRLGLVELKRRRGGPTLAEMWSKRAS